MIKNTKKLKNGYTLLEVLFYISLFVIFSVLVIDTLMTMTRSFKTTTINSDIVNSSSIMERMSREIRQAYTISNIASGDLTVVVYDIVDSLSIPTRFVISNGNLEFYKNNVFVDNLNSTNSTVESLSFNQITTAKGSAVKIVLGVSSNRDPLSHIYYFYDTIVLRSDYGFYAN